MLQYPRMIRILERYSGDQEFQLLTMAYTQAEADLFIMLRENYYRNTLGIVTYEMAQEPIYAEIE